VLELALAFQFLTTLPVPIWRKPTAEQMGRAQRYFPLVGVFAGALAIATDALFSSFLPAMAVAALLLASQAVLTGALHLDGFADCCDALLGFKDVERRLQILKDSRIGSYGSVGLICLLLLKWAALASLVSPWRWGAFLVAPTLGRWAMVCALIAFPYARVAGTGSLFKQHSSVPSFVVATAFALVVSLAALRVWGLIMLLAAGVVAWLLGRWMLTRIPGLTGDCYGAVNEVVESFILLFALALSARAIP